MIWGVFLATQLSALLTVSVHLAEVLAPLMSAMKYQG